MKAIKGFIITICVITVYLITAIPWIKPLVNLQGDPIIDYWVFGISIIECCVLTVATMIAMGKFSKWFDSKLKKDEKES